MKTSITNISARGALTAVNAQSEHPDKAVELLNLINTDVYLRNLLNYGIEGIHWEKVEVSDEEAKKVEGKPYIYDTKVKLIKDKFRNYSVHYWVQGGLFNTYVWRMNRLISGQLLKNLMMHQRKPLLSDLTLIWNR